jgi:molybdenum cofactor biosynthesis enzyme MoaA
MAIRRAGLEVLPYARLRAADRADWPKLIAALGLRLGPTDTWFRLADRPPARLATIVPAIELAAEAALHHGIALRFDRHGPPPCAGALYARHPDLFERLLLPEPSGASPNAAAPACPTCALAPRCRWNDPPYLARYGASEIVGIAARRHRHVSELGPDEPLDLARERWFVRRSELPAECVRPWTSIELMGIEPKRAAVCNEDWARLPTPALEAGTLRAAWNGPYFQRFRQAHGAGRADEVCWPHCLLRARRRAEPHPRDEVELTGKREPFLRNLIRTYQAMIERATVLESSAIELAIGPTYRCNSSCLMCHSVPKRHAGERSELPPSFYGELAELLPTLRSLHVSGPGEPLLAEPFVEFLRETDWSGLPDLGVHLTTNGTRLDAELLGLLERVPMATFIVSLNAATADTYARVTGHDRFERVVANLRRLRSRLHAFVHRRPTLQLSFVVLRSNYRELGAFLALVDELRAGPLLVPIECDQHNASEAVWQDPADLGQAIGIIDELTVEWRRRDRFVHHLRSLRDALVRQGQERHQKKV